MQNQCIKRQARAQKAVSNAVNGKQGERMEAHKDDRGPKLVSKEGNAKARHERRDGESQKRSSLQAEGRSDGVRHKAYRDIEVQNLLLRREMPNQRKKRETERDKSNLITNKKLV